MRASYALCGFLLWLGMACAHAGSVKFKYPDGLRTENGIDYIYYNGFKVNWTAIKNAQWEFYDRDGANPCSEGGKLFLALGTMRDHGNIGKAEDIAQEVFKDNHGGKKDDESVWEGRNKWGGVVFDAYNCKEDNHKILASSTRETEKKLSEQTGDKAKKDAAASPNPTPSENSSHASMDRNLDYLEDTSSPTDTLKSFNYDAGKNGGHSEFIQDFWKWYLRSGMYRIKLQRGQLATTMNGRMMLASMPYQIIGFLLESLLSSNEIVGHALEPFDVMVEEVDAPLSGQQVTPEELKEASEAYAKGAKEAGKEPEPLTPGPNAIDFVRRGSGGHYQLVYADMADVLKNSFPGLVPTKDDAIHPNLPGASKRRAVGNTNKEYARLAMPHGVIMEMISDQPTRTPAQAAKEDGLHWQPKDAIFNINYSGF